MQAIQTKYLGPTNSHGSRIKATCAAKSITRPRDYNAYLGDDHRSVAQELIAALGWYGDWVQGCLPNGDYAFVCFQRMERGHTYRDEAFEVPEPIIAD